MSAAFIIIIALVFVFGLAVGGGLIWYFLRRQKRGRPAGDNLSSPKQTPALRFYFGLIALPLSLFVLCIGLAVVFYPSLPAQVAYRFNSAGAPQSWLGRAAFISVMLGAQLLFLLAAWGISAALTRISRAMLKNSPLPGRPGSMIWLMANMVALPQLIAAFVMLDAVIFARSARHLMTPWLFVLVVVGLGSIALVVIFMQSVRQARNG